MCDANDEGLDSAAAIMREETDRLVRGTESQHDRSSSHQATLGES